MVLQPDSVREVRAPGGIAKKRIDSNGDRFAFDSDQVEFEKYEIGRGLHRRLAHHGIDAIGLALPFETRCEIHDVSHDGVVESLIRADIADETRSRIDAYTEVEAHWHIGTGQHFAAQRHVQLLERRAHAKDCRHGVGRVIRIVERRVPERHERAAHVLVDGAARREYLARHRGRKAIDQTRQSRRVGAVSLGQGREAANIAEENCGLARLATQFEFTAALRQTGDERGRQILSERAANASLVLLAANEAVDRSNRVEKRHAGRGNDGIEQPALMRLGDPYGCHDAADRHRSSPTGGRSLDDEARASCQAPRSCAPARASFTCRRRAARAKTEPPCRVFCSCTTGERRRRRVGPGRRP